MVVIVSLVSHGSTHVTSHIDHSSLHEKKLVVERMIVFWAFLMMERDTEDPFSLHKDI